MSLSEEIEKLHNLKEKGVISEEDYQEAKDSLLRKSRSVGERLSTAVDDVSSDANLWSMFIHLSQFCGYAAPLAGMIVPVVLWQIKKDDSEVIDRHGRIVVNWIISELIYAAVFGVLFLIGIGNTPVGRTCNGGHRIPDYWWREGQQRRVLAVPVVDKVLSTGLTVISHTQNRNDLGLTIDRRGSTRRSSVRFSS